MDKKYPFNDSSLPLKQRLDDLLSRLTPEEKTGFLSSHNFPVPRLGIGEWLIGTEVARGLVMREKDTPSTVLPQPIGLASTFDTALMLELGEIAGNEARIYNKKLKNTGLMLWGPTVDMLRDPRWGRNEEAYGEDPCLTGCMTAAYTKGISGDDAFYFRALPTLKHFCANNNEDTRPNCSASFPPSLKHEYYYSAFEPAIAEGGACSVMTSYNSVCGVPAMINPDLRNILKDKWGMLYAVTDGGDFSENVSAHHYGDSHAETLALAFKAGNDVMVDNAELVQKAAFEALDLGLMEMKDVDRAVSDILTARFRLGEFDSEKHIYSDIPDELLDCDEYRCANRRAALEGITLLKNNGILPLDKHKSIALVGYGADEIFGDWYTGTASYAVTIKSALKRNASPVFFDDSCDIAALRAANGKYVTLGEDELLNANGEAMSDAARFRIHDWGCFETTYTAPNGKYVECCGKLKASSDTNFRWYVEETLRPYEYDGKLCFKSRTEKRVVALNEDAQLECVTSSGVTDSMLFEQTVISDGIKRAAELASKAEVAVVCVGNNPMFVARECHDRKALGLSRHDSELIRAVHAANPNTVVLIISSYPYAVCDESKSIPAIVYTSHAGAELGNAVAAVLLGDYNPAGRTPQTWYKSHHDLPDIEDYDIISNKVTYLYYEGTPLFPFGHGLSYSDFEYSDFKIKLIGETLHATVNVFNSSERDGDEVVQIYFRKTESAYPNRPLKKLCAFSRVNIRAHEAVNVKTEFPLKRLRVYDPELSDFVIEDGSYEFFTAASSADFRCTAKLHINGRVRPLRCLSCETNADSCDGYSGIVFNFSKEYGRSFVSQNDYTSCIVFENVRCDGTTGIELFASARAEAADIKVYLSGNCAESTASFRIPAAVTPSVFKLYTAKLDSAVSGTAKLIITLGNNAKLMWLRLI